MDDKEFNPATDSLPLVVVASQLPQLLDLVQNRLRVLFGTQLEDVLKDLLGKRGMNASERSAKTEDRTLGNALDNCMTVMNLLGLKLRRIALEDATMTPMNGGNTIVPESVVIDCVTPLKLIGFLQNLKREDLSLSALLTALENLGEQLYSQVCFRYNLSTPTDDEIALIGNMPAIAEQYRRLLIEPVGRKLAACAKANKGGHLCEYSMIAKEGIFENDISMRYIERGEWGWYEMDWQKILTALHSACMNPRAINFVKEVSADLLVKAEKAKTLFESWDIGTDGWLFANFGIKTLEKVIPELKNIGV